MSLEGLQLGQYRLSRLLGSGGMGEVYLAEDARINQQVAIKVSRSDISSYPNNAMAQDTIRLFQREARAIAKLDHPHILPLFSYGEETVNNVPLIYIVMPYRPEGSFADWLQQRGDDQLLAVQDTLYFIKQAADALQYAHDNQIVHQDVKPSNFLIRANKEQHPDLLLADFGIARLNTGTANVSHAIRGTPTYMAPEQWSGDATYATDQYALAILAYELLAGHPPFRGRQEQIMYQHFHVQPQPPSTFNAQLNAAIDAVILKALAKQPEERFPSISAFAHALQEAGTKTAFIPVSQTAPTMRPNTLYESTILSSKGNTPPVAPPSSPSAGPAEALPSSAAAGQRGISTGVAILLVGLILLLIIGGLGIFYIYTSNHSSVGATNTTANTPAGSTNNLMLTATAQSNNATATVQSNNATTQANNANATSTANTVNTSNTASTPTASTYVLLKSSYSGTASGYDDGLVTFTLQSQDQQGNVSMQTTFQQLHGTQKKATYNCQGTITADRHLNLQCANTDDVTYVLAITGYVFPDGHMEGSETATNTINTGYKHVYSWKAY